MNIKNEQQLKNKQIVVKSKVIKNIYKQIVIKYIKAILYLKVYKRCG